MLDIKYIKEKPQEVIDRLAKKGKDAAEEIQAILDLDAKRRELIAGVEAAKAEQNRQIKIEEAKANLEAEKLNAQAEIERAKGAAEAIRIENGSLTSTYIQYLWVRQQNNIPEKVIYIPTEANLPILEAK